MNLGNSWKVAAQSRSPQPNTAYCTPASDADVDDSHSLKRRALSGGVPLYVDVVISRTPSCGRSSTRSSRGATVDAKPRASASPASWSATSSAVPKLEPYSTSSGVSWRAVLGVAGAAPRASPSSAGVAIGDAAGPDSRGEVGGNVTGRWR